MEATESWRWIGSRECSPRQAEKTVVYHESHDEAGTRKLRAHADGGDRWRQGHTTSDGELRAIAEARCRFAAGLTLLAAGTPMFLMGEEIGAVKPFTFDGFLEHREDLLGERHGNGSRLFRFYRDLIRLRRRHHTFSTANIQVVLTHNADRLIAFRRFKGPEQYLVVATLSDTGWPDGYELRAHALGAGWWREIFSSDAEEFGGSGISNPSELEAVDGGMRLRLPPRGFVVLRQTPQS